jgi:hypothetical protein
MSFTYRRLTGWTLGIALVTLGVLGVDLLVPVGFLSTAAVLAGVVTSAVVATSLVVRSRRAPTLGAEVIESAHAAAAVAPAGATLSL